MAVYGIDLGTTYSCIARSDGSGGIEALQIADNSTSTPSVVTFDPTTGRPIVGANAKSCMRTKPESTKAFVKRDMHKDFCDEQISVKGVIFISVNMAFLPFFIAITVSLTFNL